MWNPICDRRLCQTRTTKQTLQQHCMYTHVGRRATVADMLVGKVLRRRYGRRAVASRLGLALAGCECRHRVTVAAGARADIKRAAGRRELNAVEEEGHVCVIHQACLGAGLDGSRDGAPVDEICACEADSPLIVTMPTIVVRALSRTIAPPRPVVVTSSTRGVAGQDVAVVIMADNAASIDWHRG